MTKKTTPTKRPDGTLNTLCASLGLSKRRVSTLLAQGMPDQPQLALEWRNGNHDNSVQQLRQERIRLVQEQRQKIAQENQLRAGDLIDRAEFGQTIFRVTSEAKMGFMKLSNDLPPRLEGQLAATICKILRAEIINVLRDLSNNFMKSYPDCESNLDKP